MKSNQNQIHEVKIERIVPNGYGIGFADGLTFFVALAAPGDIVRVRAVQKKGRSVFAEIVEVVKPSDVRVEPPCRYFGTCGGCDFQQMSYRAQLDAKSAIVLDCLRRIGKIEIDRIDIVPSPEQFGYRSRAQWHADPRQGLVGYFKRGTHDIIEVESCPILTSELAATLAEIRDTAEWSSFWANRIKFDAASSGAIVSVFSDELIEPTVELDYCTAENRYSYDARSFFQGNQLLIEKLIELAVGDETGEFALDLYCGVGLFTLPLARRFGRVTGIESGVRAVESARRNLENSRLKNAEIFDESVGTWLSANAALIAGTDFVVLDPPRSGTERETIDVLSRVRPKRISYVSCEPSTLARDLRILLDAGYVIDSVTALDLFPQTHHVETVARLSFNG